MANTFSLILFMMLGALGGPLQTPARPSGCEALAGRWTWFTGNTITFRDNGIADGGTVFGQCERTEAAQRKYVVRWQTGFVDTLTLSRDGNTLDGTNAQGVRVFSARMGTSSSTTSRTAKCEAVAGRWNWYVGPPVVIREDGTLDNGLLSGRCEQTNVAQRRYSVYWQNGAVDTLVLSAARNRLDGANNFGVSVSAAKIVVAAESDVDRPPNLISIPERASSVAVVIGIGSYRESEIPRLPYAQSDADVMAKYFENTAGIRKENIKVISDDRATLSDITDTIENWLVRRVTETSSVFIYYAGHGALDASTGETYLVPYEGSPESPATRLYPVKRLYEKLEALKVRDVTVFLDSCFSGGGRSINMRGRPIVITAPDTAWDFRKVSVLAASQRNQVSSDLERAKHGLFTYYLLTGIRGEADSGKDGWVDLKELYAFVREKVQATAVSELNREQTPALLGASGVESRAESLRLFRTR
jgi:hypothetical protein